MEEQPQSPSAEIPAEMMLQINDVKIEEVQGQKHILISDTAELMVVSLQPSKEEVESARRKLRLPEGALEFNPGRPLFFVLCGEYKIPLCSTVPILQAENEFTFAVPNLFVSVTLPADLDSETLDAFEILLKTYGVLRKRPTPTKKAEDQQQARSTKTTGATTTTSTTGEKDAEEVKLSTKIAGGITKAAGWTVKGIRRGTEVMTKGITKGSDKVVEHTDACEKPVVVPENYKSGVNQARLVTKSAVMLSGGLATAMIGVTAALGDQVAGVIGKRVVAKTGGDESKFDGVKEVGGSTAAAVTSVLIEATEAARLLLTATCDGVSKIVTHKYGEDVGATVEEGLGVAQDAYAISNNMKTVGLKAVLKKTAKDAAGKILIEDEEDTQPQPPPSSA